LQPPLSLKNYRFRHQLSSFHHFIKMADFEVSLYFQPPEFSALPAPLSPLKFASFCHVSFLQPAAASFRRGCRKAGSQKAVARRLRFHAAAMPGSQPPACFASRLIW